MARGAGRALDPDDQTRGLALVPVSRETRERLERFVELLLRWQGKINLIAPSTVPQVWTRHVADSLQLLQHAPAARVWIDFGSGAGFPGMVLACVLAGQPAARVHLVESDSRKAAFLREAARLGGVPAEIHNERIEAFGKRSLDKVEVVTARALAPMERLLDYTAPFLKRGAQALFLKGQDVEAELTEAAKSWHIQAELLPSLTDPRGRIVRVRSARRLRNEQAR
ncbi:MAG TPA: 16S rRNA (guanine(527)-N(7))-methyltransferase RsmG [Xanthobacteraceae bacterium]|nr:16S rRNA (guanine(527)-N(7))-methyltransferase RsmG [Xanthobacteraceae bacterium]